MGYTRKRGPEQVFEKIVEVWGLDDQQVDRLIAKRARRFTGASAKERLRHLFAIDETLSALFREDAVIRERFREPKRELGGKSALALLCDGRVKNLLLVEHFTARLAGR